MPTPVKHSQNMTKHLTKAELEARQGAEASLEHAKRVYIKPPKWLGKKAREIFEQTKKRLKSFDLLEAVDIDLLANYADAQARYQMNARRLRSTSEPKEIQAVQAWSRIALTYAEKLGFSQQARARLARQRAKAQEQDEMEELLDGAADILVNGDGAGGEQHVQ